MNKYTFLRFPEFRMKALTLSYDDGPADDARLVSILNEHGLKCTFNINSGSFRGWNGMSPAETLAYYKKGGHEIAVHGYRHLSLTEVPSEMAVNDIIEDRRNLEAMTGDIVTGMAYANGSFDDSVVEILKRCGIKYSRTCVSTGGFDIPSDWLRLPPTCHHNDPRLPELIEQFLSDRQASYYWSNRPMLFYLWGHSFEFPHKDNWHLIEDFAERFGGRDNIWYATNGEIFDYVTAYDRLEFDVLGKTVHNPTSTGVWLNLLGQDIYVGSGETVRA